MPLPRLRIQSKILEDVERGLFEWLPKIQNHTQWNDPVREKELNHFVSCTKTVVVEFNFKDFELSLHHKRRNDELPQKRISRKRLRSTIWFTDEGLGLTKENAMRAIVEKNRKDEEVEKKKEHNQFMRMWRVEKNDQLNKGKIAKRNERARFKRIKDFTKLKQPIFIEDFTVIEDLEVK